MKKINFGVSILLLYALVSSCLPAKNAEASLNWDIAYKAIVKIYTYYEDSSYQLAVAQTGSGVIINETGLILTNHHVVTVEDSFEKELPVTFKICVTYDAAKKPECDYGADLIAKDKDHDIAILKIRKIRVTNINSFNNLKILDDNSFKEGDIVQAIGYPEIGGETITSSFGVINGVINKYSYTWIKNSALTSFGSSGGALVDLNGNLIGITSAKNSDLGFAISMSSIKDWLDKNMNKDSQLSILQERLNSFVTESKLIKNANMFKNPLPYIKIENPVGWEFSRDDEYSVLLSNETDNQGGSVRAAWYVSDTYAEPMLDILVKANEMTGKFFSAGDIELGGKKGKKLIQLFDKEELKIAILPSLNYYIYISYYYGKDNKDKETVDKILAKIALNDANNKFSEKRFYEHADPYFKLDLPNNWSLRKRNDNSEPVEGQKVSVPEIGFSIYVNEITDNMVDRSNEEYFNFIKDSELVRANYEKDFGLKANKYFSNYSYNLTNGINNVIFYKYKFIDKDDNDKIKMFAAGYRIRLGKKVIIVKFSFLSDNETDFEANLKKFESEVLNNLILDKSKIIKNNSNKFGSSAEEKSSKDIRNIGKKLIGKILLQIESNGEAWYLCPATNKAHFLGRPSDAFKVMRDLGLGISEEAYNSFHGYAPQKLAGKILLRAEANGEAYYVDPKDNKMYFLGRPEDAFKVMRNLGLGISDKNFDNL